jgi:hypothetical protein
MLSSGLETPIGRKNGGEAQRRSFSWKVIATAFSGTPGDRKN